jgi:hypothetical protein
MTDFIAS